MVRFLQRSLSCQCHRLGNRSKSFILDNSESPEFGPRQPGDRIYDRAADPFSQQIQLSMQLLREIGARPLILEHVSRALHAGKYFVVIGRWPEGIQSRE